MSVPESTLRGLVTVDSRVEAVVKPISDLPAVNALGTFSEVGDQLQMRSLCVATIATGLATSNTRLWKTGARMLFAHELATLLKDIIKRRIDRTRPRAAQSRDDREAKPGRNTSKEETSFPSGHSAGATAAAFAFGGGYPKHRAAALTAAGLVSVAQVPRCAHYLTDVGAGLLIGAGAGAATNVLFDHFRDTAERSQKRSLPG